jgi:hypothetical protein
MDLEVFRRMVLAALVAVSPGAAIEVDVAEDADGDEAAVSVTIRHSGRVVRDRTYVELPLAGDAAVAAMRAAVDGALVARDA